jgi:hypothetical protein
MLFKGGDEQPYPAVFILLVPALLVDELTLSPIL